MAVKVMVAPAILKGELEKLAARPREKAAAEKKPRRRRSAIYDAEGNEVFITLMCLKCHKMRPLSQFGLRRMADGAIRNQPWCRGCRSASSGESPRRKGAAASQDPSPETVPFEEGITPAPAPTPAAAADDAARRPTGNVAAEVAAALAAGMRR
jgi:hypothetical protein